MATPHFLCVLRVCERKSERMREIMWGKGPWIPLAVCVHPGCLRFWSYDVLRRLVPLCAPAVISLYFK